MSAMYNKKIINKFTNYNTGKILAFLILPYYYIKLHIFNKTLERKMTMNKHTAGNIQGISKCFWTESIMK